MIIGLRKVEPYYFEYRAFAKERWCGRRIFDVFQKEFRDRTVKYYVRVYTFVLKVHPR